MLFDILKEKILLGPTLSIPDPSQRFYINTDWSKYGTLAVLIQAEDLVGERKVEAQYK